MPSEWNHPRRSSKEIIMYLVKMQVVLENIKPGSNAVERNEEDSDNDDSLSPKEVINNVIEEIKHSTASVMQDKKGSVVIEILARRANHYQLRVLLHRCSGYVLSLANNRYSSHCLQTLLSLAVSDVHEANNGEEDDGVPTMHDIISNLTDEMKGAWSELFCDVSGSHTARAFLQVLGGLPILAEKRGKNAKHAHNIETAIHSYVDPKKMNDFSKLSLPEIADAQVKADALSKWGWSNVKTFGVSEKFKMLVHGILEELMALSLDVMQEMTCHTCGCPAIIMLLRIAAHLDLAAERVDTDVPLLDEQSSGYRLVRRILRSDEGPDICSRTIYAMAGDKAGSHFLEAVLWLSDSKLTNEICRIIRLDDSDSVRDYCIHPVANYLIQCMLQRIDDAIFAKSMILDILKISQEIISKKHVGILYRSAQACVRLQLSTVQRLFFTTLSGGIEGSDDFSKAQKWVPDLLQVKVFEEAKDPPIEGKKSNSRPGRLILDVPCARLIENMLRFERGVSGPISKAIVSMPEEVLENICCDRLASSCLLDSIFDAATEIPLGVRQSLLGRLKGRYATLVRHRVGAHLVLKLWRCADLAGKRAIGGELGGVTGLSSVLESHPGGRMILQECMIERFSRDPKEWESMLDRKTKHTGMLSEILSSIDNTKLPKEQNKKTKKISNGQDMHDEGQVRTSILDSYNESQSIEISQNDTRGLDSKKSRKRTSEKIKNAGTNILKPGDESQVEIIMDTCEDGGIKENKIKKHSEKSTKGILSTEKVKRHKSKDSDSGRNVSVNELLPISKRTVKIEEFLEQKDDINDFGMITVSKQKLSASEKLKKENSSELVSSSKEMENLEVKFESMPDENCHKREKRKHTAGLVKHDMEEERPSAVKLGKKTNFRIF